MTDMIGGMPGMQGHFTEKILWGATGRVSLTWRYAFTILAVTVMLTAVLTEPVSAAEGRRPTIGLALSGGGSKGLAHIGVLKVLAEAGIRPDYITGTSMGAIVGGLAAIGYTAADLDTLACGLDWRTIINDDVSLRNLSLEEKSEARKYAASFPIRDNQIGLPTGLVAGHRLSVLLSHLTLSVHDVPSFEAFPIPFRCVATDVETGEAVVFDRGFLPDAIRASASIPTIFTPFPLDGRTFVDGFLVRNLPATDVRDMGADIVIGVDVGAPLYAQDDLNSLVRIMMQTISFRSSDVNSDQHEACDILIMPEVGDVDNLSFDDPADVIARGEAAARLQFDRLRALADSIDAIWGAPEPLPLPAEVDTLLVEHIDVEGLSEVSDELFMTKLNIPTPSRITPHQLERALNRAYGSQYFDRVTYRYTQSPRPNTLVIRVTEREGNFFRFGLHYDSILKSSLLLNTTFRNVGGQGSRVLFSGRFGESPVYEASYFVPTTSRPAMGLEFKVKYQNMEVIAYTPDGRSEASLDYSSFDTTLLFKTIFSNAVSVGSAVEYHYSRIRTNIAPDMYSPWDYGQVNLHAFLELDTLDRAVYPRAGYQLYLGAKRTTDTFSAGFLFGDHTFDSYNIKYLEVFQVLPSVSIYGSFHGGMLSTNVALPDHYFFIGGLRTAPDVPNMFPFAGLKPFQKEGVVAFVHTMGVQYEVITDWFVIGQVNQGKVSMDRSEMFSRADIMRGAALSIGTTTAIGPFEYSLTWSDKREGVLTNINIGYLF